MIYYHIADLAKQMQIPLSSVDIIDDSSVRNRDRRLLKISSGEHTSFVFIKQGDFDEFHSENLEGSQLTPKVHMALKRLQIMIEP